jgi:hypothetical protein
MTAPKSILLDNDFLSDVRVRAIVREFKEVGIARYVHLLTRMNDECGEMLKRHCLLLGEMIGVTDAEWERFLTACIAEEIVTEDGDTLRIKRLVKDAKNVEAKRKKWRDRQNKKRGVTRDSSVTSPGTSEEETEPEGEPELDLENSGPSPEPPQGFVKYLDHVYVSEPQVNILRQRFEHERLGDEGLHRAMEHWDRELQNKPDKRGLRCHFKDLIGWPLAQVKKEKAELERANGTRAGPKKSEAQKAAEIAARLEAEGL